jgi:hypothetical protein
MTSYSDPSFQDRIGRAADAKKKALEQLRAKPPIDLERAAERKAASLRREIAKEEKLAAKKAEKQALEIAAAETRSAIPSPRTEAERKADRDARYAARKSRKRR